jgi:pimeloyl-ACP methyl ester carboxylesterase
MSRQTGVVKNTTGVVENTTLYIIHGWTYSIAPWAGTVAALQQSGLKVVQLQVPGLTAPSRKVFTIDDYVKWADQAIPDGAIALGHSNGGRILLNLLSRNPRKLAGLILLDSAGIYTPSKQRDALRFVSKLAAPLKKITPLRKIYHKLIGAADYSAAPENMKQTLAHMLASDQHLDLTPVTLPVQIIWGENDTTTPQSQGLELHRRLVNSVFTSYPDWNHAPYINHPDETAAAIYKAYQELTK